MRRTRTTHTRVIAIDPYAQGFGFVILDGPDNLIDWGLKATMDDKRTRSLKRVQELIEHYRPDMLVTEDHTHESCWRRPRIRGLIQDILLLSDSYGLRTMSLSRQEVKDVFAEENATTKDQIAKAVTKQFPELTPYLPPERKPWASEVAGMSIFDAAAMGCVSHMRISPQTESQQKPNPTSL